MASIKVVKQLYHTTEHNSLVNELISLRPISPVEANQSHPFQTLYKDSNPPPMPIDQFAPYLSKKLTMKRAKKIEKYKPRKGNPSPTFLLTNSKAVPDDDYGKNPEAEKRPRKQEQPVSQHNLETLIETARKEASQKQADPRHGSGLNVQSYMKMEQTFDKIVAGTASMALHRLIESNLQLHFLADKVLYYHDISSVKVLYCPTTTGYCPHGTGLIGYCQYSRNTVNEAKAANHVAYSILSEANQCPPDARVLVFPLFDSANYVKGVIQVIRYKVNPPFSELDEQFIEYFQTKCKVYSRWLFQPILDDTFASDLLQTSRLSQFIESITEKLCKLFSCRDAQLWHMNLNTEQIKLYTSDSNHPEVVPIGEAGIAGYALRQQLHVSCISAKVHSAYSAKADGVGEHSVLVLPVRDPDSPILYALVLRGKRMPQFFTDNDEKVLNKIAPYVIAALSSAELVEKNHMALEDSIKQQNRLKSLLEVAEKLSGQLRLDVLIPAIMERACDLVKADRCSLFMVNETRDKLVTSFQGGLANSIEIPINAGIVGYTATSGKILNIQDAYQDSRFNRSTDLATGYRTLTLLCVPILDDKGDIRGVTEMINKLDGVFTEEDEKLVQVFNVFCGISIENARLYRASIDLAQQLRSFLDISISLSQPQTIKKLLEEILHNTRKVVGAVRASLFMIEDNGISFNPFVIDEDMEARIKKQQDQENDEAGDSLGVKKAIIAKLMQGKTEMLDPEAVKEEEERNKKIEHAISMQESVLENDANNPEKSLIIVPIVSSERAVMGAVMMQWKKNLAKFSSDDIKLLESYSVFLSISLERSKLKSIAQLGNMEAEIQTWLSTSERNEHTVPKKLQFATDENILGLSFNTAEHQGIGLFKLLFNIFAHFGLLEHYKIESETFFYFLQLIRNTYNDVPYHNWLHAVDVTQFVAALIVRGGLDKVFTKLEIMVLLLAAICHDANHDGFSNSYNVKAQTPYGILFRNQSVMETHHCSVSIGILTKDGANVFQHVPEGDLNWVWQTFIDLILSTDMAKHFDVIDEARKFFESGSDWKKSEKGKILVLKLVIKAGDISNVARVFEIADKWCDVLCEEFFRQGDLERASGMEYSSPMNDREHLDKASSQLGFYKSVCMPLFKLLVPVSSSFSCVVDQVNENMSKWESCSVTLS